MKPTKKSNKNFIFQNYVGKLGNFSRNIFFSIYYFLNERLIEPKKNVKSLSIKNYATINIEKEYKYDKINNFGTFLLDILRKLNNTNEYEYKIEQAKIDLNILNQNNRKALKDTRKLMLKNPEFINDNNASVKSSSKPTKGGFQGGGTNSSAFK